MFGLSFGEIVIIAIIALLLLGPDKLPEAAKTLGKSLRDLRRATDDIKDQVEREIYATEEKAKPALVPPIAARPVPGPAGPPPEATAQNVPGLEAALAEPLAEPPGAEPTGTTPDAAATGTPGEEPAGAAPAGVTPDVKPIAAAPTGVTPGAEPTGTTPDAAATAAPPQPPPTSTPTT